MRAVVRAIIDLASLAFLFLAGALVFAAFALLMAGAFPARGGVQQPLPPHPDQASAHLFECRSPSGNPVWTDLPTKHPGCVALVVPDVPWTRVAPGRQHVWDDGRQAYLPLPQDGWHIRDEFRGGQLHRVWYLDGDEWGSSRYGTAEVRR